MITTDASKTSTAITPASIVNIPSQGETVANIVVPQARGRFEQRDLEEAERERGNAEFKLGNFTAAVKSYTKCLGLKVNWLFALRCYRILDVMSVSFEVEQSRCFLQPSHGLPEVKRISPRSL